jgi:hypothetical protein
VGITWGMDISGLKAHLQSAHSAVEARAGMRVGPDETIVYGPHDSLDEVTQLHQWFHGPEATDTPSHAH